MALAVASSPACSRYAANGARRPKRVRARRRPAQATHPDVPSPVAIAAARRVAGLPPGPCEGVSRAAGALSPAGASPPLTVAVPLLWCPAAMALYDLTLILDADAPED